MRLKKKVIIGFLFILFILAGPISVFSIGVKKSTAIILVNNKTTIDNISSISNKAIEKEAILDIDTSSKALQNFFIENKGQLDKDVLFYTKVNGLLVGFTTSKIIYYSFDDSFSIEFKEANSVDPICLKQLPSCSNYYFDKQIYSGIKHFSSIVFTNLYEGIDLVYYFSAQGLKYDFVLQPNSDLEDIVMIYSELNNLEIQDESLVIYKDSMIVHDTNLLAWYDDNCNELIDIAFDYQQCFSENQVNYEVTIKANQRYDSARKIIIDPLVCVFSTYLGGSDLENPLAGADLMEKDMIIDEDGNILIAGRSSSFDYPILLHNQSTMNGIFDAVITKLTPDGKTLLFSTYLGGIEQDWVNSLAIDDDGNIIAIGITESPDFPIYNAIQDTFAGGTVDEPSDIFLVKLNENGSLIFSTYWGGSLSEGAGEVAIDNQGNIIITGTTSSVDYYTKNAYQDTVNGTDKCDIILTKFSSDGQSVLFSTYYGGDSYDLGRGLAIDGDNNIYLTGGVQGTNFPTINPYQTDITGTRACIFMKFSPTGTPIFASTLDGAGIDAGYTITLDSENNLIIAGSTTSVNYPLVNPTQTTIGGGLDAFITKVAADGQSLLFSTFLGGAGGDECRDIVLDLNGNYLVVGHTTSTDFPVIHGYQTTYSGEYDVFISLIAENSTLISSGYLGGNKQDQASGIRVDSQNNIIVGGFTLSSNFPTHEAYQSSMKGTNDMFIAKFTLDLTPETTTPIAGIESIITVFGFISLLGSFIILRKKRASS